MGHIYLLIYICPFNIKIFRLHPQQVLRPVVGRGLHPLMAGKTPSALEPLGSTGGCTEVPGLAWAHPPKNLAAVENFTWTDPGNSQLIRGAHL